MPRRDAPRLIHINLVRHCCIRDCFMLYFLSQIVSESKEREKFQKNSESFQKNLEECPSSVGEALGLITISFRMVKNTNTAEDVLLRRQISEKAFCLQLIWLNHIRVCEIDH